MSNRIEKIREKALRDYDSSQKDLAGPRSYYEAGAIFGATEALTLTAEQVEAAAMTIHNLVVDTMWGECASEKEADMSVMRAAFRAAGFYVEGEE